MTAPFGVLFREGRGRRGVRRCAAIRGGGGILWGGAPFRRESVRGRSGFPNRKNGLRRSGAFGRENTLGRSGFIGRVRLLFVSRRVILIFRRAQMTEIRVEAVLRRRPEDRVTAAGQADEKSVNSREGPMFWKMRFGYREARGDRAGEAGQRGDRHADHLLAVQIECAEIQRGPVSDRKPAYMDLQDAGLVVLCDFEEADVPSALFIFIFIYITNTGIHKRYLWSCLF